MSGGSDDTPATTVVQNFTPQEQAMRDQIAQQAASVYDQTKLPGQVYTGAKPVGFSDITKSAQGMALDAAGALQQPIAGINQGITYGLTGAMDVANNPYLAKAVQGAIRPITESYTDTGGVMSQIRDGAQGAGQFGSSRQGIAEGIAAGRYADAVGDVSSKMYSDAYDKGQDTFARVLGLAPTALQTNVLPATLTAGVGAQQDAMAQANENYLSDAATWSQNKDWINLNNFANVINGQGSSQSTTTQTPAKAGSDPLAGAAGGAAVGASFGPWGAVAGGVIGALMA